MKLIKSDYHKVQTSGTYSSEAQKIFLDELITNFQAENPSASQFSALADELHKLLLKIPIKKITPNDLSDKNFQWYHQGHSTCSNFNVLPPKKITPFGLPVLGLSIDKSINLLITLDSGTFNPKDYLNYRYINKRNATIYHYFEYLSDINSGKNCTEWYNFTTIFSELNNTSAPLSIKLKPFHDWRKIAIEITQVTDDLKTPFFVLLIAGYNNSELDFNRRLSLGNNCIRPEGVTDTAALPLTPTYNSLVFEDSRHLLDNELLGFALEKFKNLASAILLLKLWLERDEINSALVNQFKYGLVAAHVCLSRDLSTNASNYQIFSSTLHFIASYNTCKVYIYGENIIDTKSVFDFDKLKFLSFPILLDKGDSYNLLWRSLVGFSGLIARANEAISQQMGYLDGTIYSTKLLFTEKIPLNTRFSYVSKLNFSGSNISELKVYNQNYEESAISNFIWGLLDSEMIYLSAESILKIALGNRLDGIDFVNTADGLTMMINFNVVTRKVDRGVLFSCDSANGYSKFWNGLAETRIFAGHQPFLCISLEAIDKLDENPNISLTKYILTSKNIAIVPISNFAIYNSVQNKLEDYYFEAKHSFELISNILFSLDDKNVPLRVSRATLLDDTLFSHSDFWIPFQIYVQFESSSAWPTDATASSYVTTAFYLSLHKAILTCNEYKSIGGIKKSIIPTWKHLEIVLGDVTYNMFVDATGNDMKRVNKTEALKAIAQREVSFGPAVKLAKEWACENCIPDANELMEALGIYVYSLTKPKAVSCGFFSILNALYRFDWSGSALVVHLDCSRPEVTDKQDSQPISIRIDEDKISVPNPYLISLLIPLAGRAIGCTTTGLFDGLLCGDGIERDFTITLINPYSTGQGANSDKTASKRRGQFVIQSFIRVLEDKFPYLILFYNRLRLFGISERAFSENIKRGVDEELKIYCRINPLCLIAMSIPYLTIKNEEGLTAVNVAQMISELSRAGEGVVKEIIFD